MNTTQKSNFEACIQACLDCLRDCEYCADACLSGDMVQMMAECIKRCRDCSDTCALCARFMSRNLALYAQMCGVCAEACVG
jgi:hypothetical protein